MLKEHFANTAGRVAELSREAMEAYCWTHPPLLPLLIAGAVGAVGGALFAAVVAILVSKRRAA